MNRVFVGHFRARKFSSQSIVPSIMWGQANVDEAVGAGMRTALESFPKESGYTDHSADMRELSRGELAELFAQFTLAEFLELRRELLRD